MVTKATKRPREKYLDEPICLIITLVILNWRWEPLKSTSSLFAVVIQKQFKDKNLTYDSGWGVVGMVFGLAFVLFFYLFGI